MNNKITLRERIQYFLDNLFSKGTGAMILALALISMVIILIASAVIVAGSVTPEGEGPLSFEEAIWRSLMRTLDAGTMGGDVGWEFRWVQFFVTLGGIFVISALIGVLSSAIDARLESLRKGRSRVLESHHTVILGWNEQVFTIISELVEANKSISNAAIAILGEKDKVEMEDEIRAKVGVTANTRVICRTGIPLEPLDLEIVNINNSRSIILLSPDGDDADAEVIKMVLAITHHPRRRATPYHIVAELRDEKNKDVANVVGKDEIEFIHVGDYVARIIAQSCRQSGLSVVYTELLNFGGDEIYIKTEPSLVGKSLSEAVLAYDKCAVMGIARSNVTVQLCPPPETILQAGDQLVMIAEDESKIQIAPTLEKIAVDENAINSSQVPTDAPENTLVLGWNKRAPMIICELDNYVPKGSNVLVLADVDDAAEQLKQYGKVIRNQKVTFKKADTTDRRILNEVLVKKIDHIILLAYSDMLTPQQSDSKTLMTLLHLRDNAQKTQRTFSIVSEMLDIRNRNLAEVTQADDFIVSNKLTSLILAQVSENKLLNAVFTDLFDPEGAEIYTKPVSIYVKPNYPVNFYTVATSASQRGEIAIGYRQSAFAHAAEKSYGVVLNPEKSQFITFNEHDRIIVLANE